MGAGVTNDNIPKGYKLLERGSQDLSPAHYQVFVGADRKNVLKRPLHGGLSPERAAFEAEFNQRIGVPSYDPMLFAIRSPIAAGVIAQRFVTKVGATGKHLDDRAFYTTVQAFADTHINLWKLGIFSTDFSLFSNYGYVNGVRELSIISLQGLSFSFDQAKKELAKPGLTPEEAQAVIDNRSQRTPESLPAWFTNPEVMAYLGKHQKQFVMYVQRMTLTLKPNILESSWPVQLRK